MIVLLFTLCDLTSWRKWQILKGSQEARQREWWSPAPKGWKLASISAGWGLAPESSFPERFKLWWTPCWTWANSAPLQQWKPAASSAALKWVPPADQWSFSSPQHWMGYIQRAGLHHTRERQTCWNKKKVRKVINDLEHMSNVERLRKLE